MALFLKYRPQTFLDLVGQEPIRKTLQNALKAEVPSHAYLFTGSRGTGKTSTARIFAKGLNCTDLKDTGPCGKCTFCVQTAEGTLVDVIEIDAASNRGIDEIRDLREKILFAPNIAKRKVYIIDEVHMLTKEAFNALLKTLEEPPDHAYFCLATTEIHKVPETILSRCQVFTFQRFTLDQLINRLIKICDQEKFKYEKEALNIIAKKAEGGMRDAISLLEQLAAETKNNITEETTASSLGISSEQSLSDFYQAIVEKKTAQALELLKDLAKNGQDFRTFGHDFLGFLREKMFQNLDNSELPQIMHMIDEIEKALSRLKTSPIVELPLEIAVVNLTHNCVAPPTVTSTPLPKATPALVTKEKTSTPTMPLETKKETIVSPAEKKEETKPVTTVSVEGFPTAEQVSSQMKNIVEESNIPVFAKKSFLTTVPFIEGEKIIFYTDSEFHREKLIDQAVSSKILGACKSIFTLKECSLGFVKKQGMKKSSNSQNGSTATADDFLVF